MVFFELLVVFTVSTLVRASTRYANIVSAMTIAIVHRRGTVPWDAVRICAASGKDIREQNKTKGNNKLHFINKNSFGIF